MEFKKKIKTLKQISSNISVDENEDNLLYFSKLFNNVEYFIFFGNFVS